MTTVTELTTDHLGPAGTGWTRLGIAQRAARAIAPGSYVNLGIGIPLEIPIYLDPDDEVFLHSENGIIGMGPAPEPGGVDEDIDFVDAGKGYVTVLPGASFFDSAASFGIVRSGRLDIAALGGMQVSADGDLANWTAPGRPPGVGGAMDLVTGARQVWVLMEHTSRSGAPKLVERCSLPITGARVVTRVFTNLGVFEPHEGAFRVVELAPGVDRGTAERATEVPLVW